LFLCFRESNLSSPHAKHRIVTNYDGRGYFIVRGLTGVFPNVCPHTEVAPPSSVVKCLWEVFVWGVVLVVCVCVSVSGMLFSVGLCVCGDLLIFLHGSVSLLYPHLSHGRFRISERVAQRDPVSHPLSPDVRVLVQLARPVPAANVAAGHGTWEGQHIFQVNKHTHKTSTTHTQITKRTHMHSLRWPGADRGCRGWSRDLGRRQRSCLGHGHSRRGS